MADKLFDREFFDRLEGLSLRFPMTVNNMYSGGRRSKSHGSTVEFTNFREYIQGDDFRRIDWNAYGRFEKFFIKLFLDEKQIQTDIFLDVSESMDFGTPSKMDAAKKLACAVSYITAAGNDKVDLLAMSEGEAKPVWENITGKNAFYKGIDKLEELGPEGTTDLKKSFINYRGFKEGSGIAIVISDLMTDKGYKDALSYLLYLKKQVILVHVLSKEEAEPELSGRIRLIDSETNEYYDIEAGGKAIEYYKNAFTEYIEDIKDFCMKKGIYYLPAMSDEPVENVILEKGRYAGVIG